MLNVAPRVTAVQQEEEETPVATGGFNDSDITPQSSFREKMSANTSDDDDALSYFAALANDD